jgi:hypothetical protein
LIQLQAAELFSPAVVRLNRDLCFLAGLRRGLPIRDSTSTCRSSVTICSGLYLLIGMSSSPLE